MGNDTLSGPVTYGASIGRKAAIAFVFLVLLPFLLSLPIMVALRLRHGFFTDALTLGVMGVLFAFWMAFLLVNLLSAIRTKVTFDDDAMQVNLPVWRGPTPSFRFIERELPYDQIAAVETRGEIYRELAVPMLMRSATLVTKDDKRLKLGYAAEGEHDSALPIGEIIEKVAERAKVSIVDKGNVYVGNQYKVLIKGEAAPDDLPEVDDSDYEAMRRRNRKYMFGLAILLTGLVAIGLIVDLTRSGA